MIAPTTSAFLQTCAKPKLFVSGDRDQFGTPAQLKALVDSVPEPKKLVLIRGCRSFLRRKAARDAGRHRAVGGRRGESVTCCDSQNAAVSSGDLLRSRTAFATVETDASATNAGALL